MSGQELAFEGGEKGLVGQSLGFAQFQANHMMQYPIIKICVRHIHFQNINNIVIIYSVAHYCLMSNNNVIGLGY